MLFKVITTPNPTDPKIKDTEFKTFFPSLNRQTEWCTIEPFVQQAEDVDIVPAIGLAFYDVLESEYQASGTVANATKFKTFRLLRTALAHFTMYYAMPQLNLRIADAGVNETSASDIVPTRQWVFNLSRWETAKKAELYLDMALEHMEQQVQAENADYDDFANSDAYTVSKELLIPNAKTFQQYYNINTSRRAYTKLRPYIRKAEQIYLVPLLDEFYTELSTQHTGNTLTAANATILPYVQQLLAEYTLTLAIPDLNFVNDGDGWRIMENINGSQMPQQALMAAVQALQTRAEQNAATLEIQLKNHLYANLDDYPTYRDSDLNELTQDLDDDGIADAELDGLYPPDPGAVIL
jgi:hypothetical protein